MILEIDVHLVRFEEGRNCARLSLLDGAQQRQVLFACISHGPATAATGLCPACPEEAARAHSAQVSFERPEAPRRCDVKGTGKSLSCKRHGWWGRRGPLESLAAAWRTLPRWCCAPLAHTGKKRNPGSLGCYLSLKRSMDTHPTGQVQAVAKRGSHFLGKPIALASDRGSARVRPTTQIALALTCRAAPSRRRPRSRRSAPGSVRLRSSSGDATSDEATTEVATTLVATARRRARPAPVAVPLTRPATGQAAMAPTMHHRALEFGGDAPAPGRPSRPSVRTPSRARAGAASPLAARVPALWRFSAMPRRSPTRSSSADGPTCVLRGHLPAAHRDAAPQGGVPL